MMNWPDYTFMEYLSATWNVIGLIGRFVPLHSHTMKLEVPAPIASAHLPLEPSDFTGQCIPFLFLGGILGNFNNILDDRMVSRNGIRPLIQNGIVLNHESSTSPQDAFGDFAKFEVLTDNGDGQHLSTTSH